MTDTRCTEPVGRFDLPAPSQGAPTEDRSCDRSYRRELSVLAAAVCSYGLMQSVTVPTLPAIQIEFRTDQATAAWVLTAFLVAASVATPIGGRIGDSFGKRRVLLLSLGALTVGSLIAVLAPSIEVLIAARVVQGLGGGIIPLSFGIIRDVLPEKRIAGGIAITSSMLAVGFGMGIVVAGPISELVGYHLLFLLPAVVAASVAVAARLVLPETRALTGVRVPLISALLLGGWLVALSLGISKAPSWGWASTTVGCLLSAALSLLACWVYAELTSSVALIDLRMMARRGVWTVNLVALFSGMAMYGSFGFFPQFNQTPSENGYGFSATVTEAGHMMIPAAIASFLAGVFAARVAAVIGLRVSLILGSTIVASALYFTAFVHADPWMIYASAGFTGLGAGLTFACLANAAVAAAPRSQTGVAAGVNANLRTVGGTIGAAAMTTFVTSQTLASGYPAELGYTHGFAFLATAALLAALLGLLIPRGIKRHT
jgi:MFS family permease